LPMRRPARWLIVLTTVIAVIATLATHRRSRWTQKLDLALDRAVTSGDATYLATLIRVNPGTGSRVSARLVADGALDVAASTTPDLYVARLSTATLGSIASDPDIIRLSLDAPV